VTARLARIRRLAAKRPSITIEVTREPDAAALDDLAELVAQLLDARQRSGGASPR